MKARSPQRKQDVREDTYPSRQDPEPSMIDRKDPVYYGARQGALGPLTSDDIHAFEQDGFLFYPEMFSAGEVNELNREVQRLVRYQANVNDPGYIKEPGSGKVRSIFYVHRTSDVFKEVAKDSRLLLRARQILNNELYIHQSRINLKPGFQGKEFYWHSDFETWHVEDGMPRMRALSCSIFLEGNTALNGPTMVLPGSHQKFISCVGQTPKDHYLTSLKRQEYGVPDEGFLSYWDGHRGIQAPTGPAGSVLLFDCNILHGSNSNITPRPRSNLFLVYNSLNNKLEEPFGGQAPRPEFIASREYMPVDSL